MDHVKEMENLIEKLKEASKAYYNSGTELIDIQPVFCNLSGSCVR